MHANQPACLSLHGKSDQQRGEEWADAGLQTRAGERGGRAEEDPAGGLKKRTMVTRRNLLIPLQIKQITACHTLRQNSAYNESLYGFVWKGDLHLYPAFEACVWCTAGESSIQFFLILSVLANSCLFMHPADMSVHLKSCLCPPDECKFHILSHWSSDFIITNSLVKCLVLKLPNS